MKTFMHVINVLATLVYITTIAMENQAITYHRATQFDAQHILNIIKEYGIHERTKIVILPEQFREEALNKEIISKRLYCAKEKSDIVAFKKLFIIKDFDEFTNITQNEIRCHGEKRSFIDTRIIDPLQKTIKPLDKETVLFNNTNSVVIYCGGDYTIPSYRGKKINSQLTDHAFDEIKNDTLSAIARDSDIRKIVLLYGLTATNAGENGGIDRSPSIIKSFKKFIEIIARKYKYSTTAPLYHNRYEAYMPTFNPTDTECKPLPDDHSIRGYGNVLIFPLLPKTT